MRKRQDTIRIILDNHSAHTSKETQQFLDTMPKGRFKFVFTPKQGDWLNMIESFFSKMTKQMLRGICVNTKPELEERIYQYFEEINREPVVYHWKYKMDEISKAEVRADFAAGPYRPVSYMGKVAALLYARYKAGQKPIAMVSTDNCSHNGDKLYNAISMFADMWVKEQKAEPGFKEYIASDKVSFPWSMIDKITPRPDDSVEVILRKDGVEELDTIVTFKHTYAATFVNAEETEYLVIEDDFPNGRPDMEKGGIIFTNRETVDRGNLRPILSNKKIFGVDLYEIGMADSICEYF